MIEPNVRGVLNSLLSDDSNEIVLAHVDRLGAEQLAQLRRVGRLIEELAVEMIEERGLPPASEADVPEWQRRREAFKVVANPIPQPVVHVVCDGSNRSCPCQGEHSIEPLVEVVGYDDGSAPKARDAAGIHVDRASGEAILAALFPDDDRLEGC